MFTNHRIINSLNQQKGLITKCKPTALWKSVVISLIFCLSLSGCLKIYKKDIRQGNYITSEMVNLLRPNMNKLQVQSIMGTPALVPIFKLSRWDYYYYFKPGNNGPIEEKSLSLYFENDQLKYYAGDWALPHVPRKPN